MFYLAIPSPSYLQRTHKDDSYCAQLNQMYDTICSFTSASSSATVRIGKVYPSQRLIAYITGATTVMLRIFSPIRSSKQALMLISIVAIVTIIDSQFINLFYGSKFGKKLAQYVITVYVCFRACFLAFQKKWS